MSILRSSSSIQCLGLSWMLVLAISGASAAEPEENVGRERYRGYIGLGVTTLQQPYRDVNSDQFLSPLFVGRYKNFFFEGSRFSWAAYNSKDFSFSLLGQYRFQQFYNGSDAAILAGLEERDRAIEFGGQFTIPIRNGFGTQISWVRDISNIHEGSEFEINGFYRYRKDRLFLLPTVAIRRQSSNLVGYYYGVNTNEVNTSIGRTFFSPGTSVGYRANLVGAYDLTKNLSIIGSINYFRGGDEVANSPLTDSRSTTTVTLGLAKHF